MNSGMKIFGAVVVLLLALPSVWYLFVKANDFEVVLNAKTSPGTVYQNVLSWNKGLNSGDVSTEIKAKVPFNQIRHSYEYESHQLEMDWRITKTNDSVTNVLVAVNDLNNSVKTRIEKVFGLSSVKELLDAEFSGFNTVLVDHLKNFKVAIEGEATSPAAYAAYINLSCHQSMKAGNMMQYSTYINAFLQDNGLKLTSNPFLEIESWDKQTGNINFNFCFPIEQQEEMPVHEKIAFKAVESHNSIKATFHGNYSYTDEAWFALSQYASEKGMSPTGKIIEIFFENPHTAAGKDIYWEAAVYMGIE